MNSQLETGSQPLGQIVTERLRPFPIAVWGTLGRFASNIAWGLVAEFTSGLQLLAVALAIQMANLF